MTRPDLPPWAYALAVRALGGCGLYAMRAMWESVALGPQPEYVEIHISPMVWRNPKPLGPYIRVENS